MNIKFWRYTKKSNSTDIPSLGGTQLSCYIKSPSSVINPAIELKDDPTSYNYCYISDFGRYYYINDIVFNKGIWTCYCNVDVLGSYRSVIANTNMYVLRSAYEHDGELVDTLFPVSADTEISVLTTMGTGSTDLSFPGFDNGYYVIGVQSTTSASQNGVIYYQLTPAKFVSLISQFYANSSNDAWWGNLERGVRNALNKLDDFITSCRWYPKSFVIDTNSGDHYQIYLGSWATGVYADRVIGLSGFLQFFDNVPTHPQSARGNFVKTVPFSRYEIVHPLIGSITLNPEYMKDSGNDFELEIRPDYTTGDAKIEILYKKGNTYVVDYITYIHYAVDINLSGNDVNVTGLVSSATKTIAAAMSGNVLGTIRGVASTLNEGVTQPGHNQANGGITHYGNPTLNCYFKIIADRDINEHGLPLCKVRTPVSIPGYILPDNPHVPINGTDEERRRIDALLAAGFFYE